MVRKPTRWLYVGLDLSFLEWDMDRELTASYRIGFPYGLPYWPGSPFSNGKHSADPRVDDLWNGKSLCATVFSGNIFARLLIGTFPALSTVRYLSPISPNSITTHELSTFITRLMAMPVALCCI